MCLDSIRFPCSLSTGQHPPYFRTRPWTDHPSGNGKPSVTTMNFMIRFQNICFSRKTQFKRRSCSSTSRLDFCPFCLLIESTFHSFIDKLLDRSSLHPLPLKDKDLELRTHELYLLTTTTIRSVSASEYHNHNKC